MKKSSSRYKYVLYLGVLLFLIQCSSPSEDQKLTTVSGYQLELIERTSEVKVNSAKYVMYTSDVMIGDTVVNSSRLGAPYLFYEVPKTAGKASSPVAEALDLMNEGDSVVLWYPLADESQKPPWFGDAEYLEYRIRVYQLLDETEYATKFQEVRSAIQEQALLLQSLEQDLARFTQEVFQAIKSEGDSDWQELRGGIKAKVHEMGQGPKPTEGRYVSVAYYGRLLSTGNSFSNSFRDGRAFSFKAGMGEAIEGWDMVINEFPEGSKLSLIVPSQLGYGKRGFPPEIGPNEDLLFYMEIMKVI